MHTSLSKLIPLLLCGIALTAQATPITGQLNIQAGTVVLNPNHLGAVATVSASTTGLVTAVEGSYPLPLLADTVTYKPFAVTLGNQAITSLWSVTDAASGFSYAFDLNSITSIVQTGTNLFLNGEGTLWSTNPALSASSSLWSYGINSADGTPTNGIFSFQSNNVATSSVPDSASTMILLSVGLMGVVGIRKSLQKSSLMS